MLEIQSLKSPHDDISSMKEVNSNHYLYIANFGVAISDRAKLHQLLEEQTNLNYGLFQMPPGSPDLAANSPVSILKPSFAIPFSLPNSKEILSVGQEYFIVGDMGKSQLAYIIGVYLSEL